MNSGSRAAALAGLAGLAAAAALLLRARRARADAATKPATKCGASSPAAPVAEQEPREQIMVVEVAYCLKCKWVLRAAWIAQEVLATFELDCISVNLRPSLEGGTFTVAVVVDGKRTVVFDRKAVEGGGFPNPKDLKQAIRDAAFPERALGKCLDAKK
jgi:selenoprotein W-related protein